MDKSQKQNFCFRANFFLNSCKTFFFEITAAVILRWIWYLGLQQSIKKKCTFEWFVRELKYLDDVELVFPSDKLQTFWILNMFTCSYIQSHDTCGQHEAGDWIWKCEYVEDPKCLKPWPLRIFLKTLFYTDLSSSTCLDFGHPPTFSWDNV